MRLRLERPLGLLVLVLAVACGRTPMLYPVPAVSVPSPPPGALEEVGLEVEGVGRQIAWHRTFDGGSASRGPVLVLFHGNGENLETLRLAGVLAAFDGLERSYLALDYPGYGRSAGSPSEPRLVAGGRAAVEWMRRRHEGHPVVVVGWSLGAAVAIQLTAEGEAEALVAMSPWTSLRAIGSDHFPGWLVGMMVRERYDSLAVAPTIDRPALVIHGERDRIIPVDHGRRIAAALPGARFLEVAGYGHNDLLAAPEVWRELERFLSAL